MIEVKLTFSSLAEASAVMQKLAGPFAPAAASAPEAETPKKRAPRVVAEPAAPPPVETAQAPAPSKPTETAKAAAAPAAAPAGPTKDSLRAAVRAVIESNGTDAVQAIFEKHGCAKLSDFPPERYGALLADLTAAGASDLAE